MMFSSRNLSAEVLIEFQSFGVKGLKWKIEFWMGMQIDLRGF